ncbi:DNA helicase mcm9 [Anaeramoeba flamelloides]|uniref:DNA helicase n=1 Tax=Anaeramoeba flamelloides TaxID=1746091 RepID=A0ABQ8YME7_9EUKA|nr:DNA helicase mcm9 [Anaeramoeba flamelloides]
MENIVKYDPEQAQNYIERFANFAITNRSIVKQLVELLRLDDKENNESSHYSIWIHFLELLDVEQELTYLIITNSLEMLEHFNEGLVLAQKELVKKEQFQQETSFYLLKYFVHARVECLPESHSVKRFSLPLSKDIGSFLSFSGTVIRTGLVKMLEVQRQYECAQCKFRFFVHRQLERYNQLEMVRSCPSNRTKPCKCTKFNEINEGSVCRDYQEIKVQEQFGKLGVGTMPRSMFITLEDDLTDSCKVGDNVVVVGTILARWRTMVNGIRPDLDIFVKANSIRVKNTEILKTQVTEEMKTQFIKFWKHYSYSPLSGRNLILSSMLPQLFGLSTVKLALGLVLIGGVTYYDENSGLKIRGEPHLLLVGDPGTGKSQILKYAVSLSPRSVLTTGVGSTSAGLTVTAVKETGGEWGLEAGALVLADGGVCCIDEFDCIKKHDRATIHEAMEQQTLSIAKAGIVCSLNSRCSVIAAANPKGKYDLSQSLSMNISIASPLLSRFDIVLVLLDTIDQEWDPKIANYILNERNKDLKLFSNTTNPNEDEEDQEKQFTQLWSLQKVRAYISFVKDQYKPELSESAQKVMMAYYQRQRNSDTRNAARTTVRLLQSVIRLAQAHARLMFRNTVTIQDAIISVLVVDSSTTTSSLLGFENIVHSNFPEFPEQNYQKTAQVVLQKLGLIELLEEEIILPGESLSSSMSNVNETSSNQSKLKETFLELKERERNEQLEKEKKKKKKQEDLEKKKNQDKVLHVRRGRLEFVNFSKQQKKKKNENKKKKKTLLPPQLIPKNNNSSRKRKNLENEILNENQNENENENGNGKGNENENENSERQQQERGNNEKETGEELNQEDGQNENEINDQSEQNFNPPQQQQQQQQLSTSSSSQSLHSVLLTSTSSILPSTPILIENEENNQQQKFYNNQDISSENNLQSNSTQVATETNTVEFNESQINDETITQELKKRRTKNPKSKKKSKKKKSKKKKKKKKKKKI